MSSNHRPKIRGGEIPMPKLRRDDHLAMLQMPQIRKAIPLSKMRVYWALTCKT